MNELEQNIEKLAISIESKIIAYREHLHQHPELSFEEYDTIAYVKSKLTAIGITNFRSIAKTGLELVISNKNHLPNQSCIALRADLDALPIQEENDIECSSKFAGKMHACGHDVHTAVLLGVAEVLFQLKEFLPKPVKLIFQPGEEKNPGGASIMIKEGILLNPTVEKIFALHVFPELNVGKLGFKSGMYMASCDEIHLTIHGKGGHGALPHTCIDPIFIGATIITTLQQIISRKCDPKIPSVLSFGHFEGIGATNIIPSKVIIKGTFRTMNEEWRAEALFEIEKQILGIVETLGGKSELEINKGYPYLVNDEDTTNELKHKAEKFFGEEQIVSLPIRLTSEDFAFYSQLVPACFFRLGVRNESKGIINSVHHPKFNVDHDALCVGVKALCLAVF